LPVLDADGRLVGLHTLGALLAPRRRLNPVLVLAGGLGTRLHPITHSIPKPMVTVAGRPILERIVLHLMSCGFETIYLSVNHLAHVIEEHFGDGSSFGCTIHYLRESRPLGTGGPLSLMDPIPDTPVVVLNGDLITQCDIGGMVDVHERGGFAATIGVKPHIVEIPFGVAEVEGDRLVRLEEKPSLRRLINAGIYVFSPDAVRLVPTDVAYPITELFGECLSRDYPVGAHVIDDDWIDVGRKDELRRARGEA
jgi:NDP-sugar pyrophosphorylase family protein